MYQSITIVGNLGRDPEMRYTPSGTPVTSFNVASSRQYTNSQGEKIKETTWFRVSAWGRQAETCNQFLRRGSKVLVEGRLTADPATGGPRMWSGTDGQMRASYEITAQTVNFMSTRAEDDAFQASGPVGDQIEDDEIPF